MVEPQQLVGRYAIYGDIASGGMATVHFGRLLGAEGFSRTVAVKRLHPQYARDPDFVSMFLDEARLAARITHPNVVSTLDVIAEGGELFLVMEYVQGETLARLVRKSAARGEPVSVRIAAAVMTNVLHGLHAAHEAKDTRGDALNIVHRDVSPQNVIVGIDGVARVLDFGIAKASGRAHATKDGLVKGKLAYMAPEQLHGRVTRQTDVFAAAIVLWETLTCRRLFAADHDAEIMTKVASLEIPPPSVHVPEIPPELDAIVLRALDRDPARRFETARDMAIAIEQCAPAAAASEVGAWVDALAADVIGERAQRVAEIESDPTGHRPAPVVPRPRDVETASLRRAPPEETSGPPIASTKVDTPVARRRGSAVATAAIVGAVLGVAVLAKLGAARSTAPLPPASATAQPPPVVDEPPPAVSIVTTEPSDAASVAIIATARGHATARPARPAPSSKAHAPAKDACDPPYERAPDGKLTPKPGCL